jgi:excisionase family DNA binding protein
VGLLALGSSFSQFATKESAMTVMQQVGPRFMNVGGAAEYVGVSAASLRKWSDEGILPVYRTPGGQRRFAQADLDDFMRAMRQPAA